MCGITGILAFNEVGRFFSIKTHGANTALAHRGPDAAKLFNDYYCALGHRRLSVIDTSSDAHQPMTDPAGRYTIVFNGEIYNYRELRQELQQGDAGLQFHSQSDTEVLLQWYIRHKERGLAKLHGFFAFAIFDAEENSLFLARDRFGIKPLLYYLDEDKFVFASELKALAAYNLPLQPDFTSMALYFQLHYVPAPYTIYQDTLKLLPGHYLKVQKNNMQLKQWYQPASMYTRQKPPETYEAAKKELLQLLEQAVAERMVSDVPLGAFLSGGIDSSTVVALAAGMTDKLRTFSVGFRNEPLFDETAYAQKVAEKYKTDHTVFNLSTDDYYDHLFDMLGFFGEPFADSSALPFYILSKKTRREVTVALSGDGADEVFAGYQKYNGEMKARRKGLAAQTVKQLLPVLERLPKSRNTFWGNKFRQLHRFSTAARKEAADRYWYLSTWLPQEQNSQLFTADTLARIDAEEYDHRRGQMLKWIDGQDFNSVLRSDVNTLLPNDMLHKVDSMSMAHGLEVRVPFLDHRLVEFAFALPPEWKITSSVKKKLLQDAVRHLLPKELYRRPKKGFDVPLASGYRTDLRKWVNEVLDDDFIQQQGIFSLHYTRQLKDRIFHTNNFDQNHVWAVLAFQHWWKHAEVKYNEVG